MPTGLIGLDVGFSASQPTSGVAVLVDGSCRVGRATAADDSRRRQLHGLSEAAVTAIDAPLLPELDARVRVCERVFASGKFQKRCKPGFSHVPGTGHELRRAGLDSAAQFMPLTTREGAAASIPRIWERHNLVEAFPNAFLGVCLQDSAYGQMPRLRRGQKFDWLYDQWCASAVFERLVESLAGLLPVSFAGQCERATDHEHRAALVCLGTAACVAAGRYTAIGDEDGGYFFLAPWSIWADWAREEVADARRRFGSMSVWINGQRCE